MTRALFGQALIAQRRLMTSIASGFATIALLVVLMFSSIGDSLASLTNTLPKGMANLVGGLDFSTSAGFISAELGSIYGPGLIVYFAVGTLSSVLAGEEERGILRLLLAYPVARSRVLLTRTITAVLGVAVICLALTFALWLGFELISYDLALGLIAAFAFHLFVFGTFFAALTTLTAGLTGRRGMTIAVPAGFAFVSYLVNGLAPLVHATAWLRFISPFHYYLDPNPLYHGIDWGNMAGMLVVAVAMVAAGAYAFERRDLR